MKTNIILTSNAYWPSIGGIENSLRHLAFESLLENNETTVIVSDLGLSKFKELENIDGIEVHRYQLHPSKNPLISFLKSNINAYKLFKEHFNKNPDAIVIARFHLSVIYAYLAGFRNIKYLVPSIIKNQCEQEQKHGLSAKQKIKRKIWIKLHNYLQKKSLKLSNVFVFSETMRKQCNELVKCEPITLTKPGVDINRFYPNSEEYKKGREEFNIPLDEKVTLFVGRFVRAKRIDMLIKAFNITNYGKLILVGDGEEKQNLIALIKSLGISDRVIIVEPRRDVEVIYRMSDVFVMSSSYEPLGQTILEAFTSGLPVVAFKRSNDVNTATEELEMDDFIYYANSFSEEDLSLALNKALSQAINKEDIHNAAKIKFNWRKLYSSLVKYNS